jgi:CubicO group peptidase (beta-lactamase class C family)
LRRHAPPTSGPAAPACALRLVSFAPRVLALATCSAAALAWAPATPATAQVHEYVGSITKSVTAAMVHQLAERGQLDLDDDVTRHIPELESPGPTVTLRHLLRHTSEMSTPGWLDDGSTLAYGHGLFVDPLEGHRRIHHGGVANGFASHAAYCPDLDLTVVVLTNTRAAAAGRIEEQVARLFLGGETPATGAETF